MAFFYTPVGIRKAKKGLPGPKLCDVDPGVSCNSESYTYCADT